MSDPISTIITAAIEHAPSTGAIVAVYKAAKPFLDKILGPSAEELGEMGRDFVKGKRAENANRTLADAAALLAATRREAQAVPLRVAVPLLNAASLEGEPALAEKWAALLANAADPAQRAVVHPSFISILSDVTPADALLLMTLANLSHSLATSQRVVAFTNLNDLRELVAGRVADSDFGVSLDNLLRLRLCWGVGMEIETFSGMPRQAPLHPFTAKSAPGRDQLAMTELGIALLLACTPPTP